MSDGDDVGEDAAAGVCRITRGGAVIKGSSGIAAFRGVRVHASEVCRSVGVGCDVTEDVGEQQEDAEPWTDGDSHPAIDADVSVELRRLSVSLSLERARPTSSRVFDVAANFASLHAAEPVTTFSWRSRICANVSTIIFRTSMGISTVSTGFLVKLDRIDAVGVLRSRSAIESCAGDESPSHPKSNAAISSSNASLFRSAESARACGVGVAIMCSVQL